LWVATKNAICAWLTAWCPEIITSIRSEGKRSVVKDLESRNGTWVNGRRIKNRRHIKVGDVIQIGPFRLLFRTLGSPDVSPGLAQTQTVDLTHLDQEPFVHKHETERIVKPLGMISSYLSRPRSILNEPHESQKRAPKPEPVDPLSDYRRTRGHQRPR
jgi:hypothetical protein